MTKRFASLLLVAVVGMTGATAALPPAQGSASARAAVPDEPRLRARITDFQGAVDSRNVRRMYEMETPYIRSRMSLEEYAKDLGLDRAAPAEPISRQTVELDRVCSCSEWVYPDATGTLRCVVLLAGSRPEARDGGSQTRSLYLWEYVGREWYAVLPLEGDRCPGGDGEQRQAPQPPAGKAAAQAALPDEELLRGRLQEFYTAILAGNHRAMYQRQTPGTRAVTSFEDYQKGGLLLQRDLVSEGAGGVTVSLEQDCNCAAFQGPYAHVRCNVLVRLIQLEPGGQERTKRHIDLWEYAGGDWFYVASGQGEQCGKR